jgi:hypothetical protein
MPTLINSFSLSSTIGIGTDFPNKALTVVGDISSNGVLFDRVGNSGNWNSAYTNVNSNSANWNIGFNNGTVYSQNSASYATNNFVNSNFLNLTGGTISGATRINNNLTVFGNLSATGNSYFANTIYSTTSALSVVNIGNTGPALWVGNNGTGDIASFYDIDANLEVLHVGGNNGTFPNVGVKTSSPNVDFTVNGQISANNIIWDANGNSNNWNSTFTSWRAASATSVVSFNDTRFSKLSSQAYIINGTHIQPIQGGNTASGCYGYSNVGGGQNNTVSGYGHSNIGGGCNNTIPDNLGQANFANIGGGSGNIASEWATTVGGGANNRSCGYYSTVGGGSSNCAGNYSSVAGGQSNIATGCWTNIAGGQTNTASGRNSNVAGGRLNTASGSYSTVLGGRYATTTQLGEISHSGSRFGSTNGNFQHSIFTASTVTTNAVPKNLALDGVSTYFSVTSGTSYFFNINVLAYNLSTTLASYFTFKGFVKNPAGTITLSPNNIQEIITEDINIDAYVDVDTLNKYLTINVIGASAADVRWGAVIDTVKIMTT